MVPYNVNDAVFWMVSIFDRICHFSSLSSRPLRTVPSVPRTLCITVIFIFHHLFYYFPGKVQVLINVFAIIIIIIIIIIVLLRWEFSSPALSDGFSQGFEWEQVYLSVLESSPNSSQFNNALIWMVFTCPIFTPTLFLYHSFRDSSQCTNHN